jgi:hypothetical protein
MARYAVNDFLCGSRCTGTVCVFEVCGRGRRGVLSLCDPATRWPGAPKQRPETDMTRLGGYAAKSLGIGPLKFETDSAGLVFILYDGLEVRRTRAVCQNGSCK